MAATEIWSGRCLCGAVELRLTEGPTVVSFCHCGTCRRATGGPVSLFAGFRTAALTYSRARPRSFNSSPGIDRPFCPDCGSRIGYLDARLPGWIYVHAGILDAPERLRPQRHAWDQERLPWLHIDDGLPRLPDFSVERPTRSER